MIGCSSRKGSDRLLLGLAADQLAKRAEVEGPVRKGGFAGFFQGFAAGVAGSG